MTIEKPDYIRVSVINIIFLHFSKCHGLTFFTSNLFLFPGFSPGTDDEVDGSTKSSSSISIAAAIFFLVNSQNLVKSREILT